MGVLISIIYSPPGGEPIRVGVRPLPAASNVIMLLGADPDGDALIFTISALPDASVGTLYQIEG